MDGEILEALEARELLRDVVLEDAKVALVEVPTGRFAPSSTVV